METFPGPNFFYMAKLRRPSPIRPERFADAHPAKSPPVSPCAGATNHRPSSP